MKNSTKAVVFMLYFPLLVVAQDNGSAPPQEPQTLPEEILIMGNRSMTQMRLQLMAAEKNAYDIFNKFNDEKRFEISCSQHQPTGTRFETQICQPEFIIEAASAHGQAFFENYRAYLDPFTDDHTTVSHEPVAVKVARQQPEYQRKLRQIAEEHPEFLDAIIQYSEMQEQYKAATRTAGE